MAAVSYGNYCINNQYNVTQPSMSMSSVYINDENIGNTNSQSVYTYFPNITNVTLNLGNNTLRFSNTTLTNPSSLGVWLDSNDNGQFEPYEKVLEALNGNVPTNLDPISFAIPCGTKLGKHRMRIRITDNTTSIDACTKYNQGVSRDFDIYLQNNTTETLSINSSIEQPLCSPTTINISAVGCANGAFSWSDGNLNKNRSVLVSQSTIFIANCSVGGCIVKSNSIPITVVPQGTQNSIIQWEKSFGGTGGDVFYDIIKAADGGYLTVGVSNSPIGGNKTTPFRGSQDAILTKFDVNGNIIWDKVFGGIGYETGFKIKALSDGNYLLIFDSASGIENEKTAPNKGGLDIWIIKIDANGNIIWDKTYGSNATEYVTDLIPTSDGGSIIGSIISTNASTVTANGDRSQNGRGDHDLWFIKIDANGNKVWDKTFGGSGTEIGGYLLKAIDNSGYYTWGYTNTSNISGSDLTTPARNGTDAWLIKFDNNGNKIFDKVYSGGNLFSGASSTEQFTDMVALSDGNYLLSAYSNNHSGNEKTENSLGGSDHWLIKITPSGTVISDKTYGSEGITDDARKLLLRTDGTILIAGNLSGNFENHSKQEIKGLNDGLIYAIDANLNFLWSKRIGGSVNPTTGVNELFYGLIPDINDSFIVVGHSGESKGDRAESFGENDGWIVKMSIPLTTKPTISSPNILACVGEPFTLNAGGCTSDVLWSNGLTSASIIVKPSSNDNVFTVNCRTDANNCISIQSDVYRPIVADANQNLTGTAASGTIQARQTITSRQTIQPNTNVNYRAGKSILLEKNQSFEAKNGSVFKAEIASCAIENGLLARYDFSNNILDQSGNNRNGLVNTALFTKDRFGNSNSALSFNGVNQYVTLGNWFNYQEFTVSFWLNSGSTQANSYAMLIDNNHTGSRSWFAQQDYNNNNSYIFGVLGSPSGGVAFNLTSTWNHLTFVKGAGIVKVFMNGKLVSTATHGGSIPYDGTQNLILGAWYASGGFTRFWNGKMDDLKLYNRALTDTEITTIFQAEAPNPSLSTGLFANYKFDGDANDVSGKGNNGTVVGGATFTTDRFGQTNKALNFDGVDGHVSVPNNNTLSGFNELTMSAWVNHNQTAGGLGSIITKWYQQLGQDTYWLGITGGTNKVGVYTNNDVNTPFESPSPTPINTWTHVTFTHDSSGDKLFINGYLANSNSISGTILSSSQDLLIGADSNLGTLWRFFKGKIDDVRLYNRALSRLEVQQLYELEKP